MAPETKKTLWTWIKENSVSCGTLVTCLIILWKVSAFCTTVNIFMKDQTENNIKNETRFTSQSNDIQVLKEWKVAQTGRPFDVSR